MNSPRQYDGVSCGVFVCKYMYDLVVYNKIMDRHQYIKGFRNVIADLI
jgi:Ulp1 family protease